MRSKPCELAGEETFDLYYTCIDKTSRTECRGHVPADSDSNLKLDVVVHRYRFRAKVIPRLQADVKVSENGGRFMLS